MIVVAIESASDNTTQSLHFISDMCTRVQTHAHTRTHTRTHTHTHMYICTFDVHIILYTFSNMSVYICNV